jgi:hypothetical protein
MSRSAPLQLIAEEMAPWCMQMTIQSTSLSSRAIRNACSRKRFSAPWLYPRTAVVLEADNVIIDATRIEPALNVYNMPAQQVEEPLHALLPIRPLPPLGVAVAEAREP